MVSGGHSECVRSHGRTSHGCEQSQWVIPDGGLMVWDGNLSVLQTVNTVVIHNVGEGLGQVGVEKLFSFDMGTHSGAEFNIQTRLDEVQFGLVVTSSEGPGGFLSIQINELTGANGLGNVVATLMILLNTGCCLLMDDSMRGTVGGDCVHTKFCEWFLLCGSRCLLGAGALVALGFVLVVAAVATSTSARTSWCLVAAHDSRLFGC